MNERMYEQQQKFQENFKIFCCFSVSFHSFYDDKLKMCEMSFYGLVMVGDEESE